MDHNGSMPNFGPRILIVDDELSLRELLKEVLSDDGYQVSTASSAEEALSTFKADPFPLVITDIRMAGMNGIELLKHVKQEHEDTEVVIITSHASLDTALSALRAGAYDYLIKPFENLDIISKVVGRALEKLRLVVENRFLVEKLQKSNDELSEVNNVLREMALRDGLTGLYNHRYFQESFAKEIARSSRYARTCSLIFCDVDHFKNYNDVHGHPKGDEVLKEVAAIIAERLRQTDFAARYGGEEFVIVLPETSKEGAIRVVEDLRLRINAHHFDGGERQPLGKVTASIGVATYPDDGNEPSVLLEQADQALYRAKKDGRDRICVAGHDD